MDWSGMDYLWIIVMFLSAVWALNLTAPVLFIEDLLVSKQCNATFLQSIMMKKQAHLHLWWSEGE